MALIFFAVQYTPWYILTRLKLVNEACVKLSNPIVIYTNPTVAGFTRYIVGK